MKIAPVLLVAVSLQGCVSVSEQIANTPHRSSYSLCEALTTAALADGRVREAWAMELARRGEDCSRHLGTIAAKQNADAQWHAQASQLSAQLQRPRGFVTPPPMAPAAAAPVAVAPAPPAKRVRGVLLRHFMNGATKVCVYDRLGTEYLVSIPPDQYCPGVDG